MAPWPEQDAADLSRVGPAVTQQNAEASGQGQAAGTIESRRRDRTRPGRWTSSMTGWRRDVSFGCSRSSTSSPVLAGAGTAVHLPRHRCRGDSWKGSAMKWDSRRRSASIRAPSSSREISMSGPISAALRWTSPVRGSRPTTRSSRRSTAASGRNASTPIGS